MMPAELEPAPAAPLLACSDLDVCVPGRTLVAGLSLELRPGDLVCVLGPNGVGKTLTLHTLAGLRPPDAGQVSLAGRPMDELDRRRVAGSVGLLLQSHADAFPMTVLECATLGRFARLGIWQWESEDDISCARQALEAVDLSHAASQLSATLSGGERRRLGIATLLVQDPDVRLLDEPLNHLDPLHRYKVLERLDALRARGKAVLASIHDPAVASLYATAVLLMYGDGRWELGPAAQMLTAARLQDLYQTAFAEFAGSAGRILMPAPPASRVS